MSPSSRRLTFAVGTSLLTASLATIACADKQRVNVRPPEDIVNEGPVPEEAPPAEDTPAEDTPAEETPAPEDSPEPTNDVPEEEQPRTVNVRHPG
jgi:hypothetical protein